MTACASCFYMCICVCGYCLVSCRVRSMSANVENLSSLGCSSWQQECYARFFFSLASSSMPNNRVKAISPTPALQWLDWNVAAPSTLQVLKCVFYFKFKHLTFHPQNVTMAHTTFTHPYTGKQMPN